MLEHVRLSVEYESKYLSHCLVETFDRLRAVLDVVFPKPEVHGVVSRCPVVEHAITVELFQSARPPVGFVDRAMFHMYKSRMFLGNFTRHQHGVTVPVVRIEGVVSVVPQPQESRVCYRHKESVAQPIGQFVSHRRVVAVELTERSQYDDVEVMIDAAVFHDSLQAYDVRFVFVSEYRATKDRVRRVALHHHQGRRRRLVYLLSYERPPFTAGDFVVPEHDPFRLNEPER